MRRKCLYLCECRWIFFFLPLGARWGLLLGAQSWIAQICSPVWPGDCWTIGLVGNKGAGNRKAKKSVFFSAFLYGITPENCNTMGQGPPYMSYYRVCVLSSRHQKKKKNPRAHGQSSRWHPCAGSGQRERSSGFHAPLHRSDSFLYNQVGLEPCLSQALKLELIYINCRKSEFLGKAQIYL